MSLPRPFRFLLGLLLAQLLTCAHIIASVNGQLKSTYVGKTLTLRHFYTGDHLKFRSDGTLDGSAPVGPWTVAGQLTIKKAELRNHVIHIEGRRVLLFRDENSNKLEDLLLLLEKSHRKNTAKLKKRLRRMTAKVEISLSTNEDWEAVRAGMRSAFVDPDESMLRVVPTFWHSYFNQDVQDRPMSESAKVVFYVKDDKTIVPPRPVSNPEPEYSEEAREMRLEGTGVITLVVNESGLPEDLRVEKPLGAGLDEEIISAVEKWRFEPGRKDGRPVAVGIKTEVSFHLY